jgi:hypothetical protein
MKLLARKKLHGFKCHLLQTEGCQLSDLWTTMALHLGFLEWSHYFSFN